MTEQRQNQFDEVRQLVEADRLEEASDRLAEIDGFRNYASQLRARLTRLDEQDRKGVRTSDEIDADRNKISDDILGIIASTPVADTPDSLEGLYADLRPALKEAPFVLPHRPIASFTGRWDELQQLEAAIFQSTGPREAGIAGLTGTGGIGKSVLAFHFATINKGRFPDGVIGLRVDEDEPEIIAQRFAYHAGATIPPGDMLSPAEIMQSVFRNKQALLIFDNAEDASVKALRPGGNGCAVIITTRNKGLLTSLEIPAAGRVELDPFSLGETRELLGKIIGAERVDAEPEALERIHQLVGGLPLAIRIVGGTLEDQPFTTLDEYTQLLADESERLRLLRDPEDPDLNVEASFEVSLKWLESLNETDVIEAFACLGACPREGFSLLAAQVVSEQDELSVKGLLGRLTRLSLVNQGDRADKFNLHPLLSVFARRKAEAFGILSAVEQRHTDFFVDYVLDRREPSRDNFRSLELELNSLLLAGRRLASSAQPTDRFYIALEPFLEALGYWSQALQLIDLFSEAAHATGNFPILAQMSLQRGQFLLMRGLLEEAKASFLEGDSYAERIESSYGRQHTHAMLLNSLGGVYQRQGNFEAAVAAFERSKEIHERLGDERGTAISENSLGSVYQRQGNFEAAVAAFERSKESRVRFGDEWGTAMVENSLGGVYQRQGNFKAAVAAFERSKEILERFGD
jgi:tetratricopeptide (TPR) repeat protein